MSTDQSLRLFNMVAVAAVLLFSTGCLESLSADESECETEFGVLQDVEAVQMDMPPEPRAIDTSDEALADSIRAHDGVATIAFKPEDAQSTFEAEGMRPAVPCEVFASGLEMVADKGVEINHVLQTIGAATVTMDPDLAGSLRGHGLVDYIEPRTVYELAI